MYRIVIPVILVILAIMSTLFIVDQRYYAVVFSLGEIKQIIKEPGLHFKLPPPFENVIYLDKRMMTIDNPEPERLITAEKKNLLVDSYIKWRIADPHKFYISFRGDEKLAADRLTQLVRSALNEVFTQHMISELVSTKRDAAMQSVRQKVAPEAIAAGIEIIDVRLRRVDLLAEISESVYRRMEAERKRVANELRSTGAAEAEQIRADADRQREIILANAYRDAQKIKGFGDAQAANIYGKAFGRDPQFAKFYQSLESYRSSFNSVNDVVVLDASSDFFRFMRSPSGASIPNKSSNK